MPDNANDNRPWATMSDVELLALADRVEREEAEAEAHAAELRRKASAAPKPRR
jgi:hypothetical protein